MDTDVGEEQNLSRRPVGLLLDESSRVGFTSQKKREKIRTAIVISGESIQNLQGAVCAAIRHTNSGELTLWLA